MVPRPAEHCAPRTCFFAVAYDSDRRQGVSCFVNKRRPTKILVICDGRDDDGATRLVDELARLGIEAAFYRNDAEGGDVISQSIRSRIEQARTVLVLCSKHFTEQHANQATWIGKEWRLVEIEAERRGLRIIPVRLRGYPRERLPQLLQDRVDREWNPGRRSDAVILAKDLRKGRVKAGFAAGMTALLLAAVVYGSTPDRTAVVAAEAWLAKLPPNVTYRSQVARVKKAIKHVSAYAVTQAVTEAVRVLHEDKHHRVGILTALERRIPSPPRGESRGDSPAPFSLPPLRDFEEALLGEPKDLATIRAGYARAAAADATPDDLAAFAQQVRDITERYRTRIPHFAKSGGQRGRRQTVTAHPRQRHTESTDHPTAPRVQPRDIAAQCPLSPGADVAKPVLSVRSVDDGIVIELIGAPAEEPVVVAVGRRHVQGEYGPQLDPNAVVLQTSARSGLSPVHLPIQLLGGLGDVDLHIQALVGGLTIVPRLSNIVSLARAQAGRHHASAGPLQ